MDIYRLEEADSWSLKGLLYVYCWLLFMGCCFEHCWWEWV